MQAKTAEAIAKRFETLPRHHIDTAIFFESQKGTKLGDFCASYLNRVGYKYRGEIALSVLGEFLLVTLRDITQPENREMMLRIFDQILRKRKIDFAVAGHDAYQTALKVMELDPRIEGTDALNYAVAVENNADSFVTLDEKLLCHKTLEKEFGVKIIHPVKL
ncbi:MAG TPA: hypothetical protein VI979_03695 [archaeon]|nr:hypothetical protein [archaeon]